VGISSGEEHRLRYIFPWSKNELEIVTTSKESGLFLPEISCFPKMQGCLEDLTGGVPRVVAYVKREFINLSERLINANNMEKLRYAFDEVDALLMQQASTEIVKTYDERNPYEQSELLAYLEKILLPINGYPRVRDGKLFDKGFIYSDGSVLRPVHGPARLSLLNFLSRYTSFEIIQVCTS
jgi:hypothetical protein